ncbi:sugar kinase [Paenibacillus sp. J22TS3]|uniref:sugar kinase n=1 Tax=Paenibacillus sp. J22TS3 TaxID=2807192 RepID=UPI001B25D677|nr:sugar kinase [Paenibacillus sp. J22TS3]GIP21000.1 2-dehydro-3-deoxygluconokinase [Paenibacillus sp. J22TS3]
MESFHSKLSGSPEVVTFGESMALLMPQGPKGLEYSAVLDSSFGGAESNVAIGLSRLGHKVGWCGRLGDDPFGRKILRAIQGEGVDVSRAALAVDAPTGFMMREQIRGRTSVHYYRKHSAASRMTPGHLDEEYIKQASILHLTGISMALSPSCLDTVLAAVDIAKQNGVKVSFDPNIRLKLWSAEEARRVILPLLRKVDYFLPGYDELKLLYQTESMGMILRYLNELSAITVIKGGQDETLLVEEGLITPIPYYKVDHVTDTVGAGDGFCAGFLSGLLEGKTAADAVKLGNLVGAMVIQVTGDWEGLPLKEEVRAYMDGLEHVER